MDREFSSEPERAVFLSDAHLCADDTHARHFLALAERAAAERAALFVLGDLFDLWFGSPRLTFRFQNPLVEGLRRLRHQGLCAYYVEGNRDFFLARYHEGTTFDAVSEGGMHGTVGGRRVFLSHGDTVNRADLAYRFWKGLSKNRAAYGAVQALPGSLFLPLAERLERRLKRTNKRFRGTFPEAECRDFAFRLFARGIDVVVLGHFHAERLIRFAPDGAAKVLAILPAWRDAWRYFYLAGQGGYGFRTFRPEAPLFPP